MPAVSAGNYAMAFGDFRRAYTIVDRTGMTVVRDEFSEKRKGIVEFTMNRWNTGQVTLAEPIKLLKIKA
jgi:HK97 family phage major capsid protein